MEQQHEFCAEAGGDAYRASHSRLPRCRDGQKASEASEASEAAAKACSVRVLWAFLGFWLQTGGLAPPHNPIVLATTRAPPAGLQAGRGRVCVGSVARGEEEMGPSRSPPPAAHRLRNSNQFPWNVTWAPCRKRIRTLGDSRGRSTRQGSTCNLFSLALPFPRSTAAQSVALHRGGWLDGWMEQRVK